MQATGSLAGRRPAGLPQFPFRSSTAERSTDNRQITERYRAEGCFSLARKLAEESVCLKHRSGRCESVASHQFSQCCAYSSSEPSDSGRSSTIRRPASFSVPVVKEMIIRPREGRVPSASLGGNIYPESFSGPLLVQPGLSVERTRSGVRFVRWACTIPLPAWPSSEALVL